MRTYGLIGYPLSHSFSPAFFSEKFKREKIRNAEYKLFPLKKIQDFPCLLDKESGLCGLNVTIPYKQSVIPFLDELDEIALRANAVNCIRIVHQKNKKILIGHNTDIQAFQRSLKKYLKPFHAKAMILGTGGASRAVMHALLNLGIDHLFFVTRQLGRGKPIVTMEYNRLSKDIMDEHKIIINTTPLGMHPDENACPPLPYRHITEKHLLFDLIYNPAETLFMKKGRARGATVVNGLEMLRLQAEKSWDIWNSGL